MTQDSKRRLLRLVELVVAAAILTSLSSLTFATASMKRRAMRKNTQALIEKIKTALDQYYSEFHDDPPDGYDNEPGWTVDPKDAGSPLGGGLVVTCASGKKLSYRGSGCLIYFLCHPITNIYNDGLGSMRRNPCNKGEAFLPPLKSEEFSVHHWDASFDRGAVPGSVAYKDEWSRGEIVDAFLFPIHYDKVERFDPTRFSGGRGVAAHPDRVFLERWIVPFLNADELPASEACCSEPGAPHGPPRVAHADPRSEPEGDGCIIDGPARPRNLGGVDIWSHGGTWANGKNAISNWK